MRAVSSRKTDQAVAAVLEDRRRREIAQERERERLRVLRLREAERCKENEERKRRREAMDMMIERARSRALEGVPYKPSTKVIMSRICRALGVGPGDINGPSRSRHIVLARQAIVYWVARIHGYSLTRLAMVVNRTDHTTAYNAMLRYPIKRAEQGRTLRMVCHNTKWLERVKR